VGTKGMLVLVHGPWYGRYVCKLPYKI